MASSKVLLKNQSHIKKNKFSLFSIIICLFLALYSVMLIGLIIWAIRGSLLPYDYAYSNYFENFDPWGLNTEFHPENYLYVFQYLKASAFEGIGYVYIEDSILYSFLYSFISAFLQTFCTAIVAYLTAKYDNKFSRFFHTFVLFTLVLPIAGSAASLFALVNKIGIYDTWLAPVLMKFGFTNMYYLVFYAGFKRISWNYAESAFIDGAGHFYVFFKIMLPLVAGLFGTVMLVYFIEFWNDYSFPLLYMPSYKTGAVLMQESFLSNTFIDITDFVPLDGREVEDYKIFRYYPMQTATSLIMCTPILILFIVFNKKLMGNLTEGGIKEW